jgi:hypothetical protein
LSSALVVLPLLFSACLWRQEQPEDGAPSTPPKEEQPASVPPGRETRNVFYRGTVRPAGISIYTEGSHKLVLPDGRFVLLEAEGVDLNGYVDEEVEVFGATRSTVEAGGIIMRVERIELLRQEPEASTATGETVVSSVAPEAPAEEPAVKKPAPPSARIPERPEAEPPAATPAEAEAAPEAPAEEETAEEPAPESTTLSPQAQEQVALMARQDYGSAQWTQQYCTAHIGFCIPVHRNWWFHSFGATTSSLWHVELGTREIQNLGDGTIIVKLLSGTVESKNALNGQVREQGGNVIGYRGWTENRHFEIIAPASLQKAVQYITDQLKPLEEEPGGNG